MRRDDSRSKEWRPGTATYYPSAAKRLVDNVVERLSQAHMAMPRRERTTRLLTVFKDLHEEGRGLARDQELAILDALDAGT